MNEDAATVVVAMPHMGVSVEEGTVTGWLKEVGDEVRAEEAICEIATDKVDTEVVAPADGILARIVAAAEATVAVGEPLAELAVGPDAAAALESIRAAGDSADLAPEGATVPAEPGDEHRRPEPGDPAPAAPTAPVAGVCVSLAERAAAGRDAFGGFDPRAAARAVLAVADAAPPRPGARDVPASPVARRMAARHGVDLSGLHGSGRNGRVRKADVEAVIAGGGSAPGALHSRSPAAVGVAGGAVPAELPPGYAEIPHEAVETSRVRRVIAEHMTRSRHTAAHMTTEVDVDLSAVVRARSELNAARRAAGEPKLSYLPFLARVACDALAEHPRLNASFLGDRAILWRPVNLGVAVDTDEGLLVPVIKDCDRLTAPSIAAAIADLAEELDLQGIVGDAYRRPELQAALEELGCAVPLIDHPQGYRKAAGSDLWMPGSVEATENAILERKVRIASSPVLTWNVASVCMVADAQANRKPNKLKSTGRIDGALALIMGVGTMLRGASAEREPEYQLLFV